MKISSTSEISAEYSLCQAKRVIQYIANKREVFEITIVQQHLGAPLGDQAPIVLRAVQLLSEKTAPVSENSQQAHGTTQGSKCHCGPVQKGVHCWPIDSSHLSEMTSLSGRLTSQRRTVQKGRKWPLEAGCPDRRDYLFSTVWKKLDLGGVKNSGACVQKRKKEQWGFPEGLRFYSLFICLVKAGPGFPEVRESLGTGYSLLYPF